MHNNMNMTMYTQMGYTKEQVKKAQDYAQKNNLDVFDALQYIQKRQNQGSKNVPINSPAKNAPASGPSQGSILHPFKDVNLNNYEIIYSKKSSRMNMPSKKVDLRQEFSPVGLLNVYNCCYLNSLLQCYFLSSDLIKYILEAEPLGSLDSLDPKKNQVKVKRIQNEYNLLNTLKEIFARMALTSQKYINPTSILKNLVDSVGENIEYGDEKDLFETNILIIERLNQCLLYTKKYFKPEQQDNSEQQTREDFMNASLNGKSIINQSKIKERDNIKRLFYGQKVEYTDTIKQNSNGNQIVSDFVGIIINPAYGNLYKALYEEFHYEVEIDSEKEKRKIKTKKHTYIRQVPTYLYFYINRTGYNAQERQALKNEEKVSFDFVIYLDSFMEKYKKESLANNETIIGLWKKKTQLQKKRNSFDIFAKKLEECRQLASSIEGWRQRLPEQEDINREKESIEKHLQEIEKDLQKIESRKEKYTLMYIFVHRGDAVSGHYWGYGRNAQNWYKFDINTSKMKEEEILLDLYKCKGTPYALVYAKEENMPRISYKYYKNYSIANENSLTEMKENDLKECQYLALIPQGTKKVIIADNVQLHSEYIKRRNFDITTKVVNDYLTRFNYVESYANETLKNPPKSFKHLPCYDNFAVYLWTKNQFELAKYSIYETCLKAVANMTPMDIMEQEVLLALVQKQFSKKTKKNKTLKHFCIEFQPQEGEKYTQLFNDYLEEKEIFMISLKIISWIENLEKFIKEGSPIAKETQIKINKVLRRVALMYKMIAQNNSYIKFILTELIPVFILKFVRAKCVIRLNDDELGLLGDDKLINQMKILGIKDYRILDNLPVNLKEYEESRNKNYKAEKLWNLEDIGKGPNSEILQKKFTSFIELTKTEVKIFRKLTKQGIYSQINDSTGEVEDYNGKSIIQPHQQEESLI